MKRFYKASSLIIACLSLFLLLAGCSQEKAGRLGKAGSRLLSPSILSSTEDLNLQSDGGSGYSFDYGEDTFYAEYLTDTWRVYNSYRIKNSKDILLICKALSKERPVPSRDRESTRTPEDMAFEWEQHNIAYDQLPEGNYWRETSRNVDLDPDDQGKTFKEIYEERTGKKLDFDTILEHQDEIEQKIREKLGKGGQGSDHSDLDRIIEKMKEKLTKDDGDFADQDLSRMKEKIKEKLKEKVKEKLRESQD